MKFKLLLSLSAAIALSGCDDTEVKEVTKEVVVEKPVTVIEKVEVPVIVEVPKGAANDVQLGTRAQFLVNQLEDGELKTKLQACQDGPFYKTDFSIGHRGAPMQYPEHTKESYVAAARMGAGILECDVTFTKDKELVCRHSQCDLHTTTNILAIPELAAKCSQPFTPADESTGAPASAQCCTSDITLAEFRQLKGKMDGANPNAKTVAEYLQGTANWRTDLYASQGTLLTHKESIELFKSLNVKMTPELKSANVPMPYEGMTQAMYAQKMIDEYKALDVAPEDVFAQSFNLEDVKYWISNEAQFGAQAVYLDDRYDIAGFNPNNPDTWQPTMAELKNEGVQIIAPPLWMLVTLDNDSNIVPSEYAKAAKAAGLDIITWTLERSGPLAAGGGWYYQSISDAVTNDSDALVLLDVLATQVGVIGVFSDWPATTSFYASCMNMTPSI
ncbi:MULTISPECIES: glycerophosphodiester phosphodiesterase family protein [Pseudoalteromonas]|uniref:glycerophosphodiester phosphodiesterase n=1 Tax=Pseudoalteromonas amylolytica TaxID=1859457 RepID=A0A1S1MSJ7_9GAMM|nr:MULTISPECIES: glycerophosphodiester phosphodiesterase family protein [Pseudoalteromonas]OHU85764.1 glycerophosphodiester phosphodiesterase [Pseudoalteromonas sp. JW3]OHU87334.1 glycerophosphodiester phosphodiesterase [Pseudoalteromonas amylolytica]